MSDDGLGRVRFHLEGYSDKEGRSAMNAKRIAKRVKRSFAVFSLCYSNVES